MARTPVTPVPLPGHALPTPWVAVTEDTGDNVNGNEFVSSGRDLVVARAVGGTCTPTFLTVADDEFERFGNWSLLLQTTDDANLFGPVPSYGFEQTDGKAYINFSNAQSEFFVVPLPKSASLIGSMSLAAGAGGSRTLVPSTVLAGEGPPTPVVTLDGAAGDSSNNNYYACSGLDLIIAWATVGTPTLTVQSIREPYWGREGDLVVTLNSATDRYLIGPVPERGFMQSDRTVHLDPSATTVRMIVIPLGKGA